MSRIVQVVPAVPSFAVDDGFAYLVPDDLPALEVGRIVRVPLGGRRVRGYVVARRDGVPDRPLKPVVGVSGDFPVFGPRLLQVLRWVANHYVAPLAPVLALAAPRNLPRGAARPRPVLSTGRYGPSPLPELTGAAAAGSHHPPVYLVGRGPLPAAVLALAEDVVAAGRTAAVVLPTVTEAERLVAAAAPGFGDRVHLVASARPAAETTAAWVAAQAGGHLLVGTRELALWPLGAPGLLAVVEEGRRAMKAPQAPTYHVRDVVRMRAAIERISLALVGRVPTAEVLTGGVTVVRPPGRAWPFVEIVTADRLLAAPTRAAVAAVAGRGGTVFVFVPSPRYAPAFVCAACRAVRRCPGCGSGPGRGPECERCGAPAGACVECGGDRFRPVGAGIGRVIDELRRRLGDKVGSTAERVPVRVGTERDLPDLEPVDLAVALGGDGLLMAPHYRAEEDALRLLVRVAATVRPGSGRRCIVETVMPDHRVMRALAGGDATELVGRIGTERIQSGFPPGAELIAVEVNTPPADADARLRAAVPAGGTVLGPAPGPDRTRWLLQGRDLTRTRLLLRAIVQEWRDGGARVRVDADPVRF